GLGFLQKPDDLLFRKALLHVRLLLRKRTLLDSGWPCLQGAGHRLAAPEIRAKFDRIEEHMHRLGLSFLVLTDELIRTQPRLTNLRRLRYEAPLSAVDYDAVRRSLRNRACSDLSTLGKLISFLGSNVVVDLLMRGHATCSLDRPLDQNTPVNISLESKHEWFLIDERTGF
ncbi:hypothetical protein, partial [Burkholderia vietnamiensis]|uniref:hypothetical protein n=1 Tax=Burkholderia vietnamiensis TaxID=60552 RepID=UPI001B9AEF0E